MKIIFDILFHGIILCDCVKAYVWCQSVWPSFELSQLRDLNMFHKRAYIPSIASWWKTNHHCVYQDTSLISPIWTPTASNKYMQNKISRLPTIYATRFKRCAALFRFWKAKIQYLITTPWASYQIRKIAGCACAGNAGNVSPRRRFQRKPLVGDPGIHHGTCVTHVPWCLSGSLTCGDGENVPGIPGACAPATLRIWQEAHTTIHLW